MAPTSGASPLSSLSARKVDVTPRLPSTLAWLSICVAFLLCLSVEGCSSGGGSTPPVSAGTSAFANPSVNQVFKSLPVDVGLTLSGGATLTNTKVTLNGVDVTSYFTGSGNTASATFSQLVYIGDNRLKVTTGTNVNRVNFTYDPTITGTSVPTGTDTGTSDGSGLGAPLVGVPPTGVSSTTLADVIPIQTRVRLTNGSGNPVWGIQVGQNAYPAPDSTSIGFQVLFLKRSDLSLVKNQNFPMTDSDSGSAMADIVGPNGSGFPCPALQGCVVVVQSLDQIGPARCAGASSTSNDCNHFAGMIRDLGGTGLLGSPLINDPNGIGYTLIANGTANVTLHPGTSYERIDCNTSDGCVQQSTPSQATVLTGIAPNGADGVLPNLAGTGTTGTTAVAATAYMPAMTVSNYGTLGGSLLLDSQGTYTFSPSAPTIRFQMGPDPNTSAPKHMVILDYPSLSGATFPNGSGRSAEVIGESAQLPTGAKGGFHLVAWDATTFQNYANATYVIDPTLCPPPSCTGPDGTTLYPLQQMVTDISHLNSRRYLIFIGSIGTLDHDMIDPGNSHNNYGHNIYMQDVWDRVAQSIQDIGGTYSLFTSLNYPGYANNPYDQFTAQTVPEDDYNLVGQWWMNDTGVANPLASEASLHMNRETEKYPTNGNLQGTLEIGTDGRYVVDTQTSAPLLSDDVLNLAAAPTLLPVAWPLTGASDSSGHKAAYAWISQQLLQCLGGCGDIRMAYPNLNQVPSVWLALLTSLTIPSDCAGSTAPDCTLSFSQDDFDTAKTQLTTELQYVALARQYQSNLLGTLQSQQANVSLLLQQAGDEVLGSVNYVTSGTVTPKGNWKTYVKDGIAIGGPILEAGISAVPLVGGAANVFLKSGFAIATLELNGSTKRVYDPNGRSLQEQAHDLVTIGSLAKSQADEYAQTLTSLGADMQRILSDWGRLQAIAIPIQRNTLVWSPDSAGNMLTVYNQAIRRKFYTQILPAGYMISHYRYAEPGTPGTYEGTFFQPGSDQCLFWNNGGLTNLRTQNPDSYAFYPGALIDGPGANITATQVSGNSYPTDVWWDLWMMQDKNAAPNCPTSDQTQLPTAAFYNTTGLFRPLDPASTTALGLYKPWFYTRSGFPISEQDSQSTSFWVQYGVDGGQPYARGAQFWFDDPDNY